METRLTAFEARRQFGKVLSRIGTGERLIVERHGHPVAAIVPMEVYAQWQRARDEFMARIRDLADTAGLDNQAAERVIAMAEQLQAESDESDRARLPVFGGAERVESLVPAERTDHEG